MGIFDSITSGLTLGFCDTSGCSKSPNNGFIHNALGTGSATKEDSLQDTIKKSWTDLDSTTKKDIELAGIAFAGLVGVLLLVDIVELL